MALRCCTILAAAVGLAAAAGENGRCDGGQCPADDEQTVLLQATRGVMTRAHQPQPHPPLPLDYPEDRSLPEPRVILCPGGDSCSPNVCCAGIAATGGRTFPCPSSDAAFDGCEGGQEDLVQALLSVLTNEEKYKFVRGYGWKWFITQPGYYVGNAAPADNKYGIPTLNMQDNGNGFRPMTQHSVPLETQWPVALTVASGWSAVDMASWASALGDEFHLKGANGILGPGLNVHRTPFGGRNAEYVSGESPYFGAKMVPGWVEAVQAKGVLAVTKHFILNSQETHRNSVDSEVDTRTMWEVYYPPFEAAVKANTSAIMCSYNVVNGKHACGNRDILVTDLKEEMGFKGWVQSDWWALKSFAMMDGVDQEMPGSSTPVDEAHFTPENLETLPPGKLDEVLARILRPMVAHGLLELGNFECDVPDCKHQLYHTDTRTPEREALNRELAAKGVVLLKNNGVLPVSSSVKKVTMLGPACNYTPDVSQEMKTWDLGNIYNIGGSGRVIVDDPVTMLDGVTAACESHGCNVTYYEGTGVKHSLAAAEGADLVFVCGGAWSKEGADRKTLKLYDNEFVTAATAALKGKTPVVTLTVTPGAAVVSDWIDNVDGALNVFFAGKQTGHALADNAFGARNPSAKLLVTFPLSEDDVVHPCHDVKCPYTEKLNVGYLALQDKPVTFPFGHGLSYTSFNYTDAGVTQGGECESGLVCVSAVVENSGSVEGVEVAQLYMSFPEDAGEPTKQLRGFHRTEALAPGASARFTLALTERDVSTYDAASRSWKQAKGAFKFYVGSSSRDIRFEGAFTL